MGVMDYLVLADDATGALDTGVQFAARGVAAYVMMHVGCGVPGGVRALVINTNSRHDAPAEAAAKVREALAAHTAVRGIYKKTDSVLRGNVGAELAALHGAIPDVPLCYVPFYPAQGRTTKGGVQHVNDVPVHQTPFADDPANPVREADIAELVRLQGLTSNVVAPPYALPGILPDVLVFDGETEEDLRAIAAVLEANGLLGVTAGCAGFAAHLPVAAVERVEAEPLRRPVLIASGSAADATLRQIDRARRSGIEVVVPAYGQLFSGESAQCVVERCTQELSRGRSVILASAAPGHPIFESPRNGVLQRTMAAMTKEILERSAALAWMAIGGDFLAEALRQQGIEGLWPLREVEAGVVLCEASGRQLLTKSGGFGNTYLLERIAKGEIA